MPRGGRGWFLRLLPDPGPLGVLVTRLVAIVLVVVLLVKVDVVEAVLAVTMPPPAAMGVQLLHEEHLETIFLLGRKQ